MGNATASSSPGEHISSGRSAFTEPNDFRLSHHGQESTGTKRSSVKYLREIVSGKDKRTKIQQDMFRAAMYGTTRDIVRVIELGDDVKVADEYGRTTLLYACLAGNIKNAQLLHSKGVSVHTKDIEGRTAIHWASTCDVPEIIYFLKECGSDINFRDIDGNTPLHLACIKARVKSVIALLRCGAKRNYRNRYGQTPAEAMDEDCLPALRVKIETLLRTIQPDTAPHGSSSAEGDGSGGGAAAGNGPTARKSLFKPLGGVLHSLSLPGMGGMGGAGGSGVGSGMAASAGGEAVAGGEVAAATAANHQALNSFYTIAAASREKSGGAPHGTAAAPAPPPEI